MSTAATSRRTDGPTTPVDASPSTWFLSPQRELRGWGRAATIEIPAPWSGQLDIVGSVLGAFDVEDEVGVEGSGPVAFGALPFDTQAAARMVIPQLVTGSSPEGVHWITHVGDERLPVEGSPGDEPSEIRLEATVDVPTWRTAVETATARIRTGALDKVVLARTLRAHADHPFDPVIVGQDLARRHPHALRFGVDGFVGASPELLVSRIGDVVRALPMAGTTVRTGDPQRDAAAAASLLGSPKNRAEHQITVDVVHEALLPWCSYLDAEPEPHVAPAGPVQHLATLLEGRLSHPPPSVLELVSALHPTPAVGGWPTRAALEVITTLEPQGRGRYAGPVGWVDRHGNGAFAVGIRSVEINGAVALVSAGVGIVADSDPLAELEECRSKLEATLPAVLRL